MTKERRNGKERASLPATHSVADVASPPKRARGRGPHIEMKKKIEYDIQEEPMALPHGMMNVLLSAKKPADAIALFMFYYYTAKWQESVAAHATISYCAAGLGWGNAKVRKTKQELMRLGLVEPRKKIDPRTKRVTRHYIMLHFRTESHPISFPQGGNVIGKCKKDGVSEENTPIDYSIKFDLFWEVYPKKTGKSAAKTKFFHLAKKGKLPKIKKLLKILRSHIETKQWQKENGEYIPNPATWLHQERWNDELTTDYDSSKKKRRRTRIGNQTEWI